METLTHFAHTIFEERIRAILKSARERAESGIIPTMCSPSPRRVGKIGQTTSPKSPLSANAQPRIQ